MQVIIIGSGIAGLTAAIALRKVGIEAVVYERAPQLAEVGAGISLWSNALCVLETLGVGDSIRRASLKMTQTEVRLRNGHKLLMSQRADLLERTAGVTDLVRMIHRADLVGALAAHLGPDDARYGQECFGIELADARVTVRFKSGHSDTADVLIGADGIRSAVRSAILGADEPRYSGYTCWRGICPRPSSFEPGYIAEWWGQGMRLGVTTLTEDRIYWWATKNSPPGGHNTDEKAYLVNAFRDWAEPAPTIFQSTPAGSIIRNDIIDRAPNRPWSKGRVCLIGDAAHSTTPNLGQGGCIAIEDSVVLARCLVNTTDPVRALEAFTAERFERTAKVIRESWMHGRMGQAEGKLACWARDRMIGVLMPLVGASGLLKHAKFDAGSLQGIRSDR